MHDARKKAEMKALDKKAVSRGKIGTVALPPTKLLHLISLTVAATLMTNELTSTIMQAADRAQQTQFFFSSSKLHRHYLKKCRLASLRNYHYS